MRPTIREVAQRAGVSLGTASNVVNGRGRVRAQTREKVERAVRELGYWPDAIAQSLISRRVQESVQRPAKNTPRLSTVGYLSVDFFARLAVLPEREERVTAERIDRALGGPAANVAVAAAKAGGTRQLEVELITTLGYDSDSEWALAELHSRGVSTIGIERSRERRLSRAFVLVEETGSRTIVNEPVVLGAPDIMRYLGRIDRDKPPAVPHCLHLEGYQVPSLWSALAEVRAAGVKTSMHGVGLPNSWHTLEGLAALCAAFDVVFINREIACDVIGAQLPAARLAEELQRLRTGFAAEEGAGLLVLSLDEEGAILLEADGTVTAVPPPSVPVVDLTGAGDTLTGVFLARWLHGAALVDALRQAVVEAAQTITATGAQPPTIDAEELAEQIAGAPSARLATALPTAEGS